MKDIPKHSFEDEFRKAFEEAEATPSPKLWAEIDAELANKEADVYKRKLYMYKLRVAAAAVVVFGFLGIWMLSSQFSGNSSLASLPQQTNSSQSNNRDGSTQADAPAENTPGQYPAVAQSTTTQPASNSPESTSRRSNGGNLTAGENGPQMQQNIGNSRIPATSPESIAALEVNKENAQQPVNRQAEEKGNAIGSLPI